MSRRKTQADVTFTEKDIPNMVKITKKDLQFALLTSYSEQESKCYDKVLSQSDVFDRVGLKPTFLYDVKRGIIFATSEERIHNQMH